MVRWQPVCMPTLPYPCEMSSSCSYIHIYNHRMFCGDYAGRHRTHKQTLLSRPSGGSTAPSPPCRICAAGQRQPGQMRLGQPARHQIPQPFRGRNTIARTLARNHQHQPRPDAACRSRRLPALHKPAPKSGHADPAGRGYAATADSAGFLAAGGQDQLGQPCRPRRARQQLAAIDRDFLRASGAIKTDSFSTLRGFHHALPAATVRALRG